MPLTIDCPSCRCSLRLPKHLTGRPVKCPSCGTTFTAPTGEREAGPRPLSSAEEELLRAGRPPRSLPSKEETEYAEATPRRYRRAAPLEDEDFARRSGLPGSSKAIAAMVLLGSCMLGDLAGIGTTLAEHAMLQRAAAGQEITQAEEEANDILSGVVGVGRLLIWIATAIVFLMWLHRAYKNLRRLGVAGYQYSPGWAVGYFFIPILNLFRPCQVAQEIWRGSDPDVALDNKFAWREAKGSLVIGLWWACWLISNVANQISSRMTLTLARNPNAQEALLGTEVELFADALSLPAAAFAILMIWHIQNRQTLKYQRLREESEFGSPY